MERWPRWVSPFLVACAAIACYAATIGYGFAYDDKQLPMSPLLARPFDFLAVLRNEYYPKELEYVALYRPLSQWSLLLNWGVNATLFGRGDVAWTFHAVNVVLHAAASVLAFVWLARLGLSRAVGLAAALLFAALPVHSEAVANVAGRSEPLALVLGLLFLLALRSGRTWLAPALLLAALWSKESAVAFLPIAVVAELCLPSSAGRRWARFAAPAFVLVAWFALRAIALDGQRPAIAYADNPVAAAPALVRVLTACAAQLRYLGLELLPLAQSPDYAFAETVPIESVLDPRVVGFVLVALSAAVVAFLARRGAPVVALGVLGYALAFASTSNLLVPIGTILAERLAYTPSLFVCVLLALGIGRLPRRAAVAVVLVLGGAGAFATVRQNRIWRDEATFVRAAVAAAPKSAKAHRNLGAALEQEGDLEGAERELARSAEIHPGYGRTWQRLGIVRVKRNRYEKALEAYRAAVERMPDLADAWIDIAQVSLALGRRADAVDAIRKVLQFDLGHKKLGLVQDRLAENAPADEKRQAEEDLAEAERSLASSDARAALTFAQEAVAASALPRAERARGFAAIADAWQALGDPARARSFREVASALRGG